VTEWLQAGMKQASNMFHVRLKKTIFTNSYLGYPSK